MTVFCKRKVGIEEVEYPLSEWEEMMLEWESSKDDTEVYARATEVKKVPIIKPIKTGREKHEFGKRSYE